MPLIRSADLGVIYQPLGQVSGDFYDFIEFNENTTGLIIGDVSGHGIEAGILVGMAKTVLVDRLKEFQDPYAALCKANESIAAKLGRDSFITACVAIYSSKHRLMSFASAGHTPITVLTPGATPKMQTLDSRGFSLGLALGEKFNSALKKQTLPVRAGDMFLFYTDGLTEAENTQGEDYGTKRLEEILRNNQELTSQKFLDLVLADWKQFRGEAPQGDDLTAICMHFL
jgi:sigma-B regulation protein RsbU (phosphoserine phosphatase)